MATMVVHHGRELRQFCRYKKVFEHGMVCSEQCCTGLLDIRLKRNWAKLITARSATHMGVLYRVGVVKYKYKFFSNNVINETNTT